MYINKCLFVATLVLAAAFIQSVQGKCCTVETCADARDGESGDASIPCPVGYPDIRGISSCKKEGIKFGETEKVLIASGKNLPECSNQAAGYKVTVNNPQLGTYEKQVNTVVGVCCTGPRQPGPRGGDPPKCPYLPLPTPAPTIAQNTCPAAQVTQCNYQPLTWADFQGPPPANPQANAVTAYSFGATYGSGSPFREKNANGQNTGKWLACLSTIDACVILDRAASGFRPGRNTTELLAHEQLHYSLAQFLAKELENALKALQGRGDTPQAAIDDLIAKADAINEAFRTRDDNLGAHDLDPVSQRAWDKRTKRILGQE